VKEPAIAAQGHAMVEHYESLRKDVVDFDGHTHAVRGLALLMRQGMAIWMKGMSEALMPAPALARSQPQRSLPVGIEQSLVDILATMTLATTSEAIV
jgi:hypothetical protein